MVLLHEAGCAYVLETNRAERKQAEITLRAQRDWFAKIVSTVPVVICSFRKRPDGTYCFPFANPTIAQIYALRPEDLEEDAAPIFTRVHPDDVDRVRVAIEESARTMTPWRCEYRVHNPTRRELWVEGHSVPTLEPDGGILWQGYIADITERKRADEALRDRERLLGIVTGSAHVGLVVVGAGYRYLFANEAYAEIFGLDPHEIVGLRVSDVLTAGWSQIQPRLDRALAGERVAYELTLPSLPGTQAARYFAVVYEPRTGDNGEPTVVVVVVDITERKRTEEALRASEERLRLLVEGVSDHAIFMLDPAGKVLTWNSEAERITGYTTDEIIGQHYACLFTPENIAAGKPEQELELAAAKGKTDVEGWRVRKNGSRFWANGTLAALYDDYGQVQGFAKVSRDLTVKRRNDALLHSVLDHTLDGIISIDEHGIISMVAP